MAIKPKTIAIRTTTTIKNNTPIYVFNKDTGDKWTVYTLEDPDGAVALCDLRNNTNTGSVPTSWVNGHVIEVQIIGNGYGFGTITLGNQANQDIDITVTADTGPAITI